MYNIFIFLNTYFGKIRTCIVKPDLMAKNQRKKLRGSYPHIISAAREASLPGYLYCT